MQGMYDALNDTIHCGCRHQLGDVRGRGEFDNRVGISSIADFPKLNESGSVASDANNPSFSDIVGG